MRLDFVVPHIGDADLVVGKPEDRPTCSSFRPPRSRAFQTL
jgi:hypothetical protein